MRNPFESFNKEKPGGNGDGIDEVIEASKDYRNLKKIDQAIIENARKSITDAVVLPPGYNERISELKGKSFSEADGWNELYAVIAAKGEVIMGGQPHGADRVIELIEDIKSGKGELDTITRTDGLREKVAELLEI